MSKTGNIPLSLDSAHTAPITGGDTVVKLKMENSDIHHITGTQTIIDDIICWSTSKSLAVSILECMYIVMMEYRASFKLGKCKFFYKQFEYVVHNIMAHGNRTTQ